jgi:hypothetical protein
MSDLIGQHTRMSVVTLSVEVQGFKSCSLVA